MWKKMKKNETVLIHNGKKKSYAKVEDNKITFVYGITY